ncbi:hypothetical protein D9C73_009952 [Collichthys lucidus]|uniref:Uncharacterized protein n=1 Tax=Collichthys lucidus TaxID=240159 RepID=A0A4U5ULV8_COLLU|nr:hypothetical protein D9C73_009952 [Collichthys lucidus]
MSRRKQVNPQHLSLTHRETIQVCTLSHTRKALKENLLSNMYTFFCRSGNTPYRNLEVFMIDIQSATARWGLTFTVRGTQRPAKHTRRRTSLIYVASCVLINLLYDKQAIRVEESGALKKEEEEEEEQEGRMGDVRRRRGAEV